MDTIAQILRGIIRIIFYAIEYVLYFPMVVMLFIAFGIPAILVLWAFDDRLTFREWWIKTWNDTMRLCGMPYDPRWK